MQEYDPLIPAFRYELSFHQPELSGPIYVQDPKGYLPDNFAIKKDILPFLRFFDGSNSLSKLIHHFSDLEGIEHFSRSLIQQLDEALLLHTAHFSKESEKLDRDFEGQKTLHSRFAGIDAEEASDWVSYFQLSHEPPSGSLAAVVKPLLLFAPHIDFRVERKMYTKAFRALKPHRYKRILSIATSHYAGYYPEVYENHPFISSRKNFESAYGQIANDEGFAEFLSKESCDDSIGLTFQDRAYRVEHALEYHLLLSQLALGSDFDFLPILVGSLDNMLYSDDGFQAQQLDRLSAIVADYLIEKDPSLEETLILVSGDLAHIGPRFGVEEDAKPLHPLIKQIDEEFLSGIAENNRLKVFRAIQDNYDQHNHCGYPPAMLALEITKKLGVKTSGNVIDRSYWYDKKDKSTVSYGAAALYLEG